MENSKKLLEAIEKAKAVKKETNAESVNYVMALKYNNEQHQPYIEALETIRVKYGIRNKTALLLFLVESHLKNTGKE